jgi:very-short-patch-repair endonuclease/predicted transcriptional regulator of viral defense system
MPPRPLADPSLTRHIGGKLTTRPSDRDIGGLARRQHGVVSRAQLIDLGLGEDAIDGRLRTGRLYRLHRGVYAVGPGLVTREGRWLAAILRAGEGAVLSHASAAELWGIRRENERSWIDVALPRSTRLKAPIRRHQVQLEPDEVTAKRQIPVTTLTRTVADIAAECSRESLEAAIREAEYLHRFRLEKLEEMLERHPGRQGATVVRACLHHLGRRPRGRTRSRLEVRFAALLARTDLPKPTLNTLLDIDGFKVEADCLGREQRVIVELDGGRAHGTRVAFEADRERDRRLQAAGWRVIRVTWRQLDTPRSLLADLRSLLREPSLTRHIGGKLQPRRGGRM